MYFLRVLFSVSSLESDIVEWALGLLKGVLVDVSCLYAMHMDEVIRSTADKTNFMKKTQAFTRCESEAFRACLFDGTKSEAIYNLIELLVMRVIISYPLCIVYPIL